jgi:hypothetical protein
VKLGKNVYTSRGHCFLSLVLVERTDRVISKSMFEIDVVPY